MGKKHITAQLLVGAPVCPFTASVCRRVFVADEERHALNSSAEGGGGHRSLLITSGTAFSFYMTARHHSLLAGLNTTPGCGELVKRYLQKREKVMPVVHRGHVSLCVSMLCVSAFLCGFFFFT